MQCGIGDFISDFQGLYKAKKGPVSAIVPTQTDIAIPCTGHAKVPGSFFEIIQALALVDLDALIAAAYIKRSHTAVVLVFRGSDTCYAC